ncbi:MAG: ferritin-like domain-containing protein [Alphaproteobacteria bacterium]|nr:ferritin-like domain-containing protein [Alphaproteobacteria bacterium]
MKHWTLDDIAWDRFDRSKVDPELVGLIKAAALVERNGGDYARYLHGVFAGDTAFQGEAERWAAEEIQHGEALGRWARLADPSWDFEAAQQRFTAGYRVNINATESIRGSRTGELIARCIVEVGTSSYYTALADRAAEPVLKQICLKIAADEFRHYKLFYDNMKRYQTAENLGFWGRLRIGIGRITESEDDELAYAFFAANDLPGPYDRRRSINAYIRRAYACYQPAHIDRGLGMVMKAVGLKPRGRLHAALTRLAVGIMQRRVRRLAASGA